MNQRIKEIAKQAGTWEYFNAEDEKTKAMDAQALQNFAELLIQEVLDTIQNESANSGDEWETGLLIAENAVRKHFGVEEK